MVLARFNDVSVQDLGGQGVAVVDDGLAVGAVICYLAGRSGLAWLPLFGLGLPLGACLATWLASGDIIC